MTKAQKNLPPRYAQVVLGLPVDKAFTYIIADNFQEAIRIGQRVVVPFGRRLKIGYVVGLANKTAIRKVKPITSILDHEPLLDEQMLKLTRQVADYYCASWGEVIEAACPANLRKRKRPLSARPHVRLAALPAAGPRQKELPLSAPQRGALRLIKESISKKRHQIFLLHGITASGKTEVYLQSIAYVLEQGRTSIVLVPEISLTPQTVERFHFRFGSRIAIMHSRLLASQRAAQWQAIKTGEARIVIGARSAVFAPVANLGLIVVDEEHETTYKQQDAAPRYHAREVAILRARLAGAAVILGSATPSLESFYQAKRGKSLLLSLPERVTKRDLPRVQIIDMRREIQLRRKRVNILSRTLEQKTRKVIEQGEQAIFFLNRRGFSTFVNCRKCGFVSRCPRCNVSLTYHYAAKKLICHYCNFALEPPEVCPQCNSAYLSYFGLGTEKVESELHRIFPQARIARLDTDATKRPQAHSKILGDFKKGNIDLLVGTQMLAKGLDFPRVSLVGVVCADTALNRPDFRSGERTFNLLTQVAGRAGRGEKEGEVVIQTYVPGHYAICASIRHDYQQFYRQEIISRKSLNLPPFSHLVNLTLRGRNQDKICRSAEQLSKALQKKKEKRKVAVFGPAPEPVSKLRGIFRWHILLSGKDTGLLLGLLRKALKDFRRYKGTVLAVDVDPL